MTYNIAYTASTYSLQGEVLRVDILIKDDQRSTPTELTLEASNPITIQWEGDGVFKPLKMSGATVSIQTPELLFDLFTGTLNDVICKIYRDGELIWYGFKTPNLYTGDYNDCADSVQLEFVDILSSLERVKFRRSSDDFFRTFKQYIQDAIAAVDAAGVVVGIDTIGNIPVDINTCGCMERNYIDETDENDGAMTYQEVLESIMQYLGVTAMYYGSKILLVDQQSLDKLTHNLESIGTASTSATISLGEVYNSVTVIENTNPVGDLIQSPIEANNLQPWMNENESRYKPGYKCYKTPITIDDKEYVELQGIYNNNNNGWRFTPGIPRPMYIDSYSRVTDGGIEYSTDIKSNGKVINEAAFVMFTAGYEKGKEPSKLDVKKNFVYFVDTDKTKLTWTDIHNRPFAVYDSPESFVLGKGGYIVLAMKYKYQYRFDTPIYYENCEQPKLKALSVAGFGQTDTGALVLSLKDEVKVVLRVGDKYYNGSSWQAASCSFKVGHTWDMGDNIYQGEVELDSSASYSINANTDAQGVAIPLTDDLFGDIHFEIFPPSYFGLNLNLPSGHKPQPPTTMLVEDVGLTYCGTKNATMSLASLDNSADEDIKHHGYIDERNVVQMDDVELKTNTYDSSITSYSYVIKRASNGSLSYLTTPKMEEQLINKLIAYHSQPKVIYTNVVNDYPGAKVRPYDNMIVQSLDKTFSVDSLTLNLKECEAGITLNEL